MFEQLISRHRMAKRAPVYAAGFGRTRSPDRCFTSLYETNSQEKRNSWRHKHKALT